MIIISTSLNVPGQPSSPFLEEAWLPFRNCEMDCSPGLPLGRLARVTNIMMDTNFFQSFFKIVVRF